MPKLKKCKQCSKQIEGQEFKCNITTSSFCSKGCIRSYQATKKKIKADKEKLSRKNKRESVSMLTKKLDGIFSEYIRRKYSNKEGMITCISCDKELPWQESHNCHWIGRGNKQYRFDEDNCRPGCAGCNTFNQEFHQRIFTIRQIERLGKDIVDIMIDNTKYIYKQGKTELKELIEEYKIKLTKLNND